MFAYFSSPRSCSRWQLPTILISRTNLFQPPEMTHIPVVFTFLNNFTRLELTLFLVFSLPPARFNANPRTIQCKVTTRNLKRSKTRAQPHCRGRGREKLPIYIVSFRGGWRKEGSFIFFPHVGTHLLRLYKFLPRGDRSLISSPIKTSLSGVIINQARGTLCKNDRGGLRKRYTYFVN